MESKDKTTFTFKTTINCGGCVAKVTPVLNASKGIESWTVDTENKDKVLSVTSNGITEKEIIDTVQKAGFKIERIN
ncbi:heavy-metal-associated domain-containing protein [Dysgonomonas sp. ZJ279]|uniref:heavy-metal-associated domain-containing protein n=1 Tax=Dysgonomonas sp. ZJ279 TaxID=2709796 RepID=UPI0013ED7CC4|nr:heavy-metal-associated domain-containing protein [Dysgonomonas sp. ZJ279]